MAYIRSQASGNYSNPATWVGGVVPGYGDLACTLTHRITLDIDPLAVLCVNKKDFVDAGGTVTTAFTGGFIVPTGATRNVVGFRYDGTSTSATTSATTAALVLNGLTLNLGYLQILLDNVPTGTQSQYIVYVTGVAAVQQTLNITGSIDYCIGSGNYVSRYYTTLIYLAGVANGDITVNLPILSAWSPDGFFSNGMSLLLTNAVASAFTFNINASIPAAVQTTKNSNFFKCLFTSTGLDNQKVNINTPTLGSGLAPVGSTAITVYFTTVSSITAVAPLSIDMAYETGNVAVTYLSIQDVRNAIIFDDLTLLGSAGQLVFTSMDLGSSFTCGDIIVGYTPASAQFLLISGEPVVTMGNITCSAHLTDVATFYPRIKVTTTQAITVGNLSYGSGNLAHIPLLQILGVMTKPVTLGTIDARNLYCKSNSAVYSPVLISNSTTDTITINGDVYGANYGNIVCNTTIPNCTAAIAFASAETIPSNLVVVNGDVYGGKNTSAMVISGGALTNFKFTINGKVTAASHSTIPRVQSPYAIFAAASPVSAQSIDCGSNAMFPISGYFSLAGLDKTITVISEEFSGTDEYLSARFWRIAMTENNGDVYYSLQEVNIIGGSGLSLVSPATVTNQSSYYDGGWYQASASKLVDGSTENGETDVWVSSGGSPTEWVSFDLGQRMPVKAFKLLPQVYAPVTVSRSPKTFKIQYSNDNANWSDAYIAENQTSWSVGVYNEYTLPYQPNASSGGSVDLTSVIQKLDSIKKDTTFIKSIVA